MKEDTNKKKTDSKDQCESVKSINEKYEKNPAQANEGKEESVVRRRDFDGRCWIFP